MGISDRLSFFESLTAAVVPSTSTSQEIAQKSTFASKTAFYEDVSNSARGQPEIRRVSKTIVEPPSPAKISSAADQFAKSQPNTKPERKLSANADSLNAMKSTSSSPAKVVIKVEEEETSPVSMNPLKNIFENLQSPVKSTEVYKAVKNKALKLLICELGQNFESRMGDEKDDKSSDGQSEFWEYIDDNVENGEMIKIKSALQDVGDNFSCREEDSLRNLDITVCLTLITQ